MLLTLEAVRNLPPAPPRALNPRVDRDLETVCLKCLEKDPGRRYGSADELAEDLDRWLRHEPVRARRAPLGRRLLLLCRRYPASAALGAAAAVFVPALISTLVGAVVSVGFERDRALAQEALAETREKDVRRQLYAADQTLAYRDWLQGDVNSLKHLVDRWRPAPGAEDLRDCAWRLLAPLQAPDALYPPEIEATGQDVIYSIAVSADGQTIATAGKDGTVRLRRTGEKPVLLRGHRDEVNWVAFDRPGKRLVTASDDGTARIWDVATGAELLQLDCHVKELVAAEFTPDGQHLVTGGAGGMLRVWHVPSGKPARDIPGCRDRVCGLALTPDGRYLAAGTKSGMLHVWCMDNAALRYQRPLAGQVQCLAFSPDGKTLAAGDIGGHVWLLDATTGEALRMFHCDNGCAVEGVAFSPDGGTLASCGLHGRVRLWDLRRGTFRRNLDLEGADCRVWCVAFTSDGQGLLCGATDGAIHEWDLSTAHAARYLPVAAVTGLCSLAFSPDARTLALAGGDGAISFWDPQTCRNKPGLKPILTTGRGHRLIQFEAATGGLVVCGPDAALECWDVDSSSRLYHLHGLSSPPTSLCARPGTNEWLTCLAGSAPVSRDTATGEQACPGAVSDPCPAAAWSPDGTLLAVALPGRVRVLRDGVRVLTDLPLSGRLACPLVAFSPNGKTLAAVDYGGIVRLWSTAGWGRRQPLEGRQISVRSLAFSPSGKILAVGGEDGTVKIWQVASGQELFTLTTRSGGRIFAVAFAPDESCLAAASENHDGTRDVALWPTAVP
jgi:WD40 repeat protein